MSYLNNKLIYYTCIRMELCTNDYYQLYLYNQMEFGEQINTIPIHVYRFDILIIFNTPYYIQI